MKSVRAFAFSAFFLGVVLGAQAHAEGEARATFYSQARDFLAGSDNQVQGTRCFARFTVSESGLTLQMKSRDGVQLNLTLSADDLINGAPISAHSTLYSTAQANQLVYLFGENSGGVFAIAKKEGRIVDVTVAFEDEERDLSCSIRD